MEGSRWGCFARGGVAFARVEVVLARGEVGIGPGFIRVFHRFFHTEAPFWQNVWINEAKTG